MPKPRPKAVAPDITAVSVGSGTMINKESRLGKKVVIHVPKGVIIRRLDSKNQNAVLVAKSKKVRKSRAKPKKIKVE